MDETAAGGALQMVAQLLRHQEHQGDALDRLSVATESIARDMWSFLAGSMKIALVYPWPNEPTLFRAVLLRSPDEERRLAQALPGFEKAPPGTMMEDWLKSEGFKPIDVAQVRLGKHDGMYRSPQAAPAPLPEIGELKLELESSVVQGQAA